MHSPARFPMTEVSIPAGDRQLQAFLTLPESALGMVAFAHGSGSGRHSPRNQFVARALNEAGLGTLLADLLDEQEAEDQNCVFDVHLLADRLLCCADWLSEQPQTQHLPIGYFGASTGSAAALIAAAKKWRRVRAVVSRGGRPDLAWDALPVVCAPTLLLVDERDGPVVEWNEQALEQLIMCPKQLIIIPNATHLFPEPGALEAVAQHASEWFCKWLQSRT